MSALEWTATVMTVGSICGLIGWVVFVWCREPDEDRHCWQCRKVTGWRHNECQECRWADQQL